MLIVYLRRVRHSPLYGVFSVHAGQYCLRGGEAIRSAGPVLILFDAARVPDSVHQKAMWPNCVARVHAGPRAS